jgi:hypothetical protein
VPYDWKTDVPGVFSRHADNCPVREGGECTCGPLGYRSSIRDWESSRRTVSPMYETLVEALGWQRDQIVSQDASRGLALDRGELGALIDEFLQAVEDGLVGGPQARGNVRALRGALSYADSELGTMDVQDVRRRHIQGMLDQLRDSGLDPARIHAVVDALHALYAYAIQRELVGFSPVVELDLPVSGNGVAHSDNGVPQSQNGIPAGAPALEPPVESWTTSEPLPPPPAPVPPYTAPYPPPPDTPPQFTPPEYTPPQYTPPQYTPPQFTPPQFAPPYPQPPYGAPPPSPYGPTGYTSDGFTPPYAYTQPQWTGYGPSGPLSTILGSPPTTGLPGGGQAQYDATMQERWLWWTVRIIVIVFVLIALVLVAESV